MTEGTSNWNMANNYFEMLQALQSYEAAAYAENDLRELWKWVTWFYDNTRMALDKPETFDAELDRIDEEIYKKHNPNSSDNR